MVFKLFQLKENVDIGICFLTNSCLDSEFYREAQKNMRQTNFFISYAHNKQTKAGLKD